jgi:hypothetical protein
MKKEKKQMLIFISLLILFTTSGIFSGFYLIKLFKLLGVDHISISHLIGTYFFGLSVNYIIGFILVLKLDEKK